MRSALMFNWSLQKKAGNKTMAEVHPEFERGWDLALRAARELTLLAMLREHGTPAVEYDSPDGRIAAQALKLLRKPTDLEQALLSASFPTRSIDPAAKE